MTSGSSFTRSRRAAAFLLLLVLPSAGAAGAAKLPGVGLDYYPGKPDPYATGSFDEEAFVARYGVTPDQQQRWPGMVAELFFVNAHALRSACLAGALGDPEVYDCWPKMVEQLDLSSVQRRPAFVTGEPGQKFVYDPENFYCRWWVNQGSSPGATPQNPILVELADKPSGAYHQPPANGWACPVYHFNSPPSSLPSCVPDAETLCLRGGRFAVSVAHDSPATDPGRGKVVPQTADTGAFWFFDDDNLEVIVKVLDGCAVNQRFWVFAAGLSDVDVELRVRDLHSGEERLYVNPQGTPFQPIQDTSAFATCD